MSVDVAAGPSDLEDEERLRGAEAWLLGRELFGIRPGLARMVALLERLGDPQTAFDAVHVVGSNGKTSTVTMIAALLQRRGIAAGAYVSPHLVSFRERVMVAGEPASPGVFADAVARVRAAAEALEAPAPGEDGALDGPVTQFEAVTAAAFLVLADAGVRCAVVEAGLGGRWDATNVLPRPSPTAAGGAAPPPSVTVLTSISLEHTRWLGDTVQEIAAEKVAVLRPGGTLVLAAGLPAAAHDVAEARAVQQGGTLVEAAADPGPDVPTPGAAHYQRANLATAVAAVGAWLAAAQVPGAGRDPAAERDVATRVVVPGRFEVVERPAAGAGPVVIHDGAHNEAGFRALADALDAASPARPLVAVVGVLDDKDPAGMLAALARWSDVLVLTAPSNPRRLEAERLAEVAAAALPGRETHVVGDPHDALARARTLAGRRGTVLVTGSLHLVADLRRGRGAAPGARF